MTRARIAVVAGAALAAVATARALSSRRGRARRPQRAMIVALADATSMSRDRAVRSVQRADMVIEADALREIWTPDYLERLARTYWRFLTRTTLGLIQVRYTERERYVVLLARPLRLITFRAPEYEMDREHGLVRWRIERGLLVSREGRDGRGYLKIEVRRRPGWDAAHALLHVEVEVANFYPWIASRLSRRLYNATQSRLHVLISHGFLRSLARLDLAERRPAAPRPAVSVGAP